MPNIIVPPHWRIPESQITPESVYRNRRAFLQEMGFAGAGLLTASQMSFAADAASPAKPAAAAAAASGATGGKYPAPRNPKFDGKGLTLSDATVTAEYNNFYEFSTSKERVHRLVGPFTTDPWTVRIDGLCEKPMTVDARELIGQFPLEERVYRFRCVEAWAMIVPWTGVPLAKLLAAVKPTGDAKFVKFTTALRPEQMPGIARLREYPWPYTEGLRIDEAMNDLVMVATGIYGKPLPKQNGAPLRLVVPWKYGYKSIKSIVRIELVAKQPATLWETLAPDEYPFESNVNPRVPHPRWSQASERLIDTGDRVPTLPYNGYAEQVAGLYGKS
jgi:sulfoxide reductase catalytic subunit YedY